MIVIERGPFLGQSGTLFLGERAPTKFLLNGFIIRTKIKSKFEILRFIFENRKINDENTSFEKKHLTEKEKIANFADMGWLGG